MFLKVLRSYKLYIKLQQNYIMCFLIYNRAFSSCDLNNVIYLSCLCIHHLCAHVAMVICVVVGCSKRLECDKDVSFHRIPAILKHLNEQDFELSKRRDGYIAAISREDIDLKALEKYQICSRHFISKSQWKLYDVTNPNWLPTINLGHSKLETQQLVDLNRYERAQRRSEMQKIKENVVQQIGEVISQETTEAVVREEVLKLLGRRLH